MNTRYAESGTGRSVLLEHAVGAGPNGSGSAGVWSQDLAYGVDTVRVYSKSQNPPDIPWKPVSKVHPVETRHGTVWVGKWVAHGAGYQMEYSGCYDDHDIPSPRDRHALRGTLICKASLPIILLGHNIWGLGEPDVAAALAIWDERVYEDTGQIRDLMSWPLTKLDVTSDRVLGSEEDVWVVINRLAGMEVRGKVARRCNNGLLWRTGRNATSHSVYDKYREGYKRYSESLREMAVGRLRVESRAKGQKPIRSCFPDTPEFDTVRLRHLTHPAAMDALRQVAKPIVEKVDYAMKESPASVGETWERLSRSGLNFQQIAKVVGVLNMVREAGWDGCMARGLTRSGMYDYKKLFREVGIRP